MPTARADFLAGIRDSLPAIPANVSFGIIAGVAASNAGFSAAGSVVMSAFVFAGAAQLAVIELVGENAPLFIVIATALIVNLRYVMYSASIAPYFEDLSLRWKLGLSAFLLDVTFAISVAEFDRRPSAEHGWYFLGVSLPVWFSWVVSTAAGSLVGTRIPPSWNLDFAVPLLFLGLLGPAISGRESAVAAGVGGAVTVAAIGVPFDLGLMIGALTGVVAGTVTEEVA